MSRALHDFELALIEPCAAMTRRGLRVDDDVRQHMMADLDAVLEPTKKRLNVAVAPLFKAAPVDVTRLFAQKWTCPACRNGKRKRENCETCMGDGQRVWLEFNPGSEKQIKVVLYTLLKLPKRTRDGKLVSDESALKSLLPYDRPKLEYWDHTIDPPRCDGASAGSSVVRDLLAYAKAKTMRAIFERLTPDANGRIHTWYNIAGTETGRFSSSETFLEEASTNLQNLPLKQAARSPLYDVRRCIVPDEGEVFLYADLSQAEARVVAAAGQDHDLLARWADPDFDVHVWTAAAIFGKDVSDVTPQERHLGKVARHALNYGMGWATFLANVNDDADVTGVSLGAAEAKRIVAAYHRLHPTLESWWRRVARSLDAQGWLATCYGRRRTFFGRRATERFLDGTHKEAIAFEPQSTVADLLNRGLLRYWDRHDCEGAAAPVDVYAGVTGPRVGRLLAQIHDAVLVSVPEEFAAREATRLRECLEETIDVEGVALTIPVSVEIGRTSWAALEKLDATVAA